MVVWGHYGNLDGWSISKDLSKCRGKNGKNLIVPVSRGGSRIFPH